MARAAADPQVMVALESFTGRLGKTEINIVRGDLFPADDPVVRRWSELFGPVRLRSSGPVVEQATAGPGEKRGV
jgi:hypothetical protein